MIFLVRCRHHDVDAGGRDLAGTKYLRMVAGKRSLCMAIDAARGRSRPRCVMVRGKAEALAEATSADGERLEPIIRIHPSQVISWGLDGAPE